VEEPWRTTPSARRARGLLVVKDAREAVVKKLVEMPIIESCVIAECAYNNSGSCNARAITVGDGAVPHCDTYFAAIGHVSHQDESGGVGACKVSRCRHNRELECTAELIRIGRPHTRAECLTFAP
jgi:hypothetical protein